MFRHKTLVTILFFVVILSTFGELTRAQEIPNPVFSDPTNVNNPICPKGLIAHLVMLGTEGDSLLRTEETLLPITRDIDWGGGTIEAIITYFIAFRDGQLIETAFDYFAQDDNGNVWYLGEDVTNYENGQLANNNGTWLAGRNGAPPALFMPTNPQVGMSWHPENRPGLVLEEDQVLSVSEQVMTPKGMIDNGMHIQENLMDGSVEFKTWAAGNCDVLIEASDEHAQTVLLNHTTDEQRTVPDSLANIEGSAEAIFDAAPNGKWDTVQQETQNIQAAWTQYTTQNIEVNVPTAFLDAVTAATGALQTATAAQDSAAVQQAANDVSFAVVDLFSYYNPAVPSDLGRLDALERQVLLDISAGDLITATDTLAQSSAIWARLRPLALMKGATETSMSFENSLNAQIAAVATQDTGKITSEATNGLELIDALEKVF